jgi:hypothetical protein
MSTKFKELLERFKSEDRHRPWSRSSIDVSSNGTSTVSSERLEEALFKRFEEMNQAPRGAAAADPKCFGSGTSGQYKLFTAGNLAALSSPCDGASPRQITHRQARHIVKGVEVVNDIRKNLLCVVANAAGQYVGEVVTTNRGVSWVGRCYGPQYRDGSAEFAGRDEAIQLVARKAEQPMRSCTFISPALPKGT